jgi:predicted outer membrane repeat protein
VVLFRRCRRVPIILGSLVCGLAGLWGLTMPSAVAAQACSVVNVTLDSAPSSDLQQALDAAEPDNTIEVTGTCIGNFVAGKGLRLVAGVSEPDPRLVAADVGPVISIVGAVPLDLHIVGLRVRGGAGAEGYGIVNMTGGSVVLSGDARVEENAATGVQAEGTVVLRTSAGVVHNGDWGILTNGAVTLFDSAHVSGNASPDGGGAIFTEGDITMNDSSEAAYNNGPGGIHAAGTVTLNDSSQVAGNRTVSYVGAVEARTVVLNDNAAVRGNSRRGVRASTVTMNDTARVTRNTGGGIIVFHKAIMNDSSKIARNVIPWSRRSPSVTCGGGIYSSFGSVVVITEHASVMRNAARLGGGICNQGGSLRVQGRATIADNLAFRGAGIATFDGPERATTLTGHASITGNVASQGGGIYTSRGLLLTHAASITNNTAIDGGGIYARIETGFGTVTLKGKSQVEKNAAGDLGGGIYNVKTADVHLGDTSTIADNTAGARGGGIYNHRGDVLLAGRSLITRNHAGERGGGVFNDHGTVRTRDRSTIAHNTPNNCAGC